MCLCLSTRLKKWLTVWKILLRISTSIILNSSMKILPNSQIAKLRGISQPSGCPNVTKSMLNAGRMPVQKSAIQHDCYTLDLIHPSLQDWKLSCFRPLFRSQLMVTTSQSRIAGEKSLPSS